MIGNILLLMFCFGAPSSASSLEEPLFQVEVKDESTGSVRRHHNNFRCNMEESERVCQIGATLDGNRLDMTTYCPLDSAWLADCTCSVSYRGNECDSCSYCREAQVFVVDCANVINNRRCATVDCNGICLNWGSGSAAGVSQNGGSVRMSKESAAAIAVFAAMCCLPCITALLCARFLPRGRSYSDGEGASGSRTADGLSAEDRKAAIEACLKTKKVDEEDLSEIDQDAIEAAPTRGTIDSSESVLTEISETTESNMEEGEASSEDTSSVTSASEQLENMNASSIFQTSKKSIVLNTASQDTTTAEEYTDEEDDRELCQICLEPFRTGDERSWSQISKCRHSFHKDCITEWLQRHDDCPCCRAKFVSFDTIQANNEEEEQNDDHE